MEASSATAERPASSNREEFSTQWTAYVSECKQACDVASALFSDLVKQWSRTHRADETSHDLSNLKGIITELEKQQKAGPFFLKQSLRYYPDGHLPPDRYRDLMGILATKQTQLKTWQREIAEIAVKGKAHPIEHL